MGTYHILYNRKGGPVESMEIVAPDFAQCEAFFILLCEAFNIDAEYWEIGVPE